ncbi:MAG: hypothetical protein HUU46_07640 [Candidatus Hydrogenedentes bacterium]|nr:hypothetical protein [Candidatus Hydrogenedentota bacterium]
MTKYINTQQKGPISRARYGRFDVSIWQWRKVVSAPPEQRDFKPEREYIVNRACIRHCRWENTVNAWDEQIIWCDVHELDNLKIALERLQEKQQS